MPDEKGKKGTMGDFRYGLKIANCGSWSCSCGFTSDFLSVALIHLFQHATKIMSDEKKTTKIYQYAELYNKEYVFQTEYMYELHEMNSFQYGIDFGYRFENNNDGIKAVKNTP